MAASPNLSPSFETKSSRQGPTGFLLRMRAKCAETFTSCRRNAHCHRSRKRKIHQSWPASPVPCFSLIWLRIAGFSRQAKNLWCQTAHRREQRIRRHDAIALRGNKRHPCIYQLLLSVEHVQRRALAGTGFLPDAVKGGLRSCHLGLRRLNLCLRGRELAPGLDDAGTGEVTNAVEVEFFLAEHFLGLPDRGVFGASLIDRHRKRNE